MHGLRLVSTPPAKSAGIAMSGWDKSGVMAMKAARNSLVLLTLAARITFAQHVHPSGGDTGAMPGMADDAMSGMAAENLKPHIHVSPLRPVTAADSARAREVVAELRTAIAKYADTSAAVADGYVFRPRFKRAPKVYHFTNRRNALASAFSFAVDRPTSLLYERQRDGSLKLVGAMYTAPKAATLTDLDARLPLSIAQWHQHVNLCMPKLREQNRIAERKNGRPVFGPASAITTKEQCDAVGGRFKGTDVPWMVHVNAMASDDLGTVFEHKH